MRRIYFANVLSTQPLPEVIEAMLPYLREHFGNPISKYYSGQIPKKAIEEARISIASLINSEAEEIVFTSCGTESNNLAIFGIAKAYKKKGRHIIISAIEHLSVYSAAKALKKEGYDISIVGVDKEGFVNEEELMQMIRDDTILISIMHGNNEIGTIQNIKKLVEIAHKKSIVFHSDGSGCCGLIPVNIKDLDVDLYTISSQSLYGPKGISALYIRSDVRFIPLMFGESQEGGRRPGQYNVAAIVGIGKAAELAKAELEKRKTYLETIRDKMIKRMLNSIPFSELVGAKDKKNRLPNIASFLMRGIEAEAILIMLAEKGIEASSSSICSAFAHKASHVLLALGYDEFQAQCCLQFSFSMNNTPEEVDIVVEELKRVCKVESL